MNTSIVTSQTTKSELPLSIKGNKPVNQKVHKMLLICGILASLLYIAMNIFIPFFYEGYNWVSQTVSELSAVDAPTRSLWLLLGILYSLLIAAFGWGVLQSAGRNRSLRIAGILLIISGLIGLTWSPMHKREVLAAGGGTFTDTWHIVMSIIWLVSTMLVIGFAAAALGKRFRIYSIVTIIIFIMFGILTGIESPGISTNQPTPMIGVWERINIVAFMLWLSVFAIAILQMEKRTGLYASTKTSPVRR